MEVTLFLLLSYQLFDWSCRTSPRALASNLEVIVKVETAPSSLLFKAATKIYNLVRKRKNSNKGKKMFVKVEEDTLKNYVVKVEEKQEKDEEMKEEKVEDNGVKRKHFCELKSEIYNNESENEQISYSNIFHLK